MIDHEWIAWFSSPNTLRALTLLLVGWPLLSLLARVLERVVKRRFSEIAARLSRRIFFYAGFLMMVVSILNQLGYTLGALLGAAGIVGMAVGFASQTSLSNIISGVFLVTEKAFTVGHVLDVEGTLGVVISIDLLSVKLRTFDNRLVRIPNEHMIKAKVTNITRYPIRRVDVEIGAAYHEDPRKVMAVLEQVADKNLLVLDEPRPLIIFKNFGASSLDFLLGVWIVSTDYLAVKNSMMLEVKEAFDREGIEIPFPHLSLYAGSQSAPFAVQSIKKAKAPKNTNEAPKENEAHLESFSPEIPEPPSSLAPTAPRVMGQSEDS